MNRICFIHLGHMNNNLLYPFGIHKYCPHITNNVRTNNKHIYTNNKCIQTSPRIRKRELLPQPFGPHTKTFIPAFTYKIKICINKISSNGKMTILFKQQNKFIATENAKYGLYRCAICKC